MTRSQARGLVGAGLEDTDLQLRIYAMNADRSIPASAEEPPDPSSLAPRSIPLGHQFPFTCLHLIAQLPPLRHRYASAAGSRPERSGRSCTLTKGA